MSQQIKCSHIVLWTSSIWKGCKNSKSFTCLKDLAMSALCCKVRQIPKWGFGYNFSLPFNEQWHHNHSKNVDERARKNSGTFMWSQGMQRIHLQNIIEIINFCLPTPLSLQDVLNIYIYINIYPTPSYKQDVKVQFLNKV